MSTPIYSRSDLTSIVLSIASTQSGKQVTSLDTPLSELDLDSLDYISFAQAMEDSLSIGPIPDSDLFKFVTLDQVVHYAESWIEKKSQVESARTTQSV